jgi:hypothetical protein
MGGRLFPQRGRRQLVPGRRAEAGWLGRRGRPHDRDVFGHTAALARGCCGVKNQGGRRGVLRNEREIPGDRCCERHAQREAQSRRHHHESSPPAREPLPLNVRCSIGTHARVRSAA